MRVLRGLAFVVVLCASAGTASALDIISNGATTLAAPHDVPMAIIVTVRNSSPTASRSTTSPAT